MSMTNNSKTSSNLINDIWKARRIYDKLGEEFIKNNNGKFIAVEPNSGEYFVGETREEAVKLSNEKYKNKVVFIRRIGSLEKVALHSPLELNSKAYACVL